MSKHAKPYQPGPKTRLAIGHLLEGRARTASAAARLAGMSRTELSRKLNDEKVKRWMLEQATAFLSGVPAMLAAAKLHKLISAKSEDVAARVATRVAEASGVLPTRESAQVAGGMGSGPVLQVVFKHMQPGGGIASIGVQIGANPVQSAAALAQPIEEAHAFIGDRYPDKEASGPSEGGLEGRQLEPSAGAPGVEKTRAAEPPPPPHTREAIKGSVAGIIFDPDGGQS